MISIWPEMMYIRHLGGMPPDHNTLRYDRSLALVLIVSVLMVYCLDVRIGLSNPICSRRFKQMEYCNAIGNIIFTDLLKCNLKW